MTALRTFVLLVPMAMGTTPGGGAVANELPAMPAPEWTRRTSLELRLMDGNYEVVVSSGRYAAHSECEQGLNQRFAEVLLNYLDAHVAADAGSRVRVPLDYIRADLVTEKYETTHKMSLSPSAPDEPMFEMFVLLRFDAKAHEHLAELYRQAVVRQRLGYAGGGLAGTLLVLSACWGVLRRAPKTPLPVREGSGEGLSQRSA